MLHKAITVNIASAATLSSAFSTEGYDKVIIGSPGTYTVYVHGSYDDSTYYRIAVMTGASASVSHYLADFNTLNGVGAAECNACAGLKYVKLNIGTAASAAKTATIHLINTR